MVSDFDLDGNLMANCLVIDIGNTKVNIEEVGFVLLHKIFSRFLDLDGHFDGEIGLWLDLLEGNSDVIKDGLNFVEGVARSNVESFPHGTETSVMQGNVGDDGFAGASLNQNGLRNDSSAFGVLAAKHDLGSTLPWSGTGRSHAGTAKLSHARGSRKTSEAESRLRTRSLWGSATSKRAMSLARAHSAEVSLLKATHPTMGTWESTSRSGAHSSHTATHALHAHLLSNLLLEANLLDKSLKISLRSIILGFLFLFNGQSREFFNKLFWG